jgi:thiol-disulfide isomerase/thioredoxin
VYQLRFANGSIHLFLRGGEVLIKTDISNLGNYQIEGSNESIRLLDMYMVLNEINHKTTLLQDRVEKLKQLKKKRRPELIALIDSLPFYYAVINKEKAQKIKKFIESQDTSLIGILAAMYLNADENYEYLIELRERFRKICPHSVIYKQFDDKISTVIPVSRGHEAPEIVIDDYNGEQQTLTDLRGNYTLIYFWASYSNPCRDDNIKLKEIYQKYSEKEFKIFAVSIDEDQKFWKDAIIKDGITQFIHGSNLVGWEDEIATIYKIEGIPYYILLDKDGIIIYRGKNIFDLTQMLDALFNK